MGKVINGIQQIGIGVADAKSVFNWYRKNLGFDILVFQDEATASLMTKYTSGEPMDRYAILAMNMTGGGGLEIWQFKNRVPEPPRTRMLLGDLGINIMKLRSTDVVKCHKNLKINDLNSVTELKNIDQNSKHFFFTDPWNNLIQIVSDDYCFNNSEANSGGVLGVSIGVSQMENSIKFYRNLLGFDRMIYDRTNVFEDLKSLPGGSHSLRRVLLRRNFRKTGGFGELLGPCEIELLQVIDREPVKIYKDRLWGDLGYIHICFDIHGMNALRNDAEKLDYRFTVDSSDSFDMGGAAGHFSYIEDPDGTLIEFVETHKVPILKKLGIYINLKKRNPHRPLPKWLVQLMRVHRVKKDLN
ncbi:MAG: VOC family protein [Aurantibacter sp.]